MAKGKQATTGSFGIVPGGAGSSYTINTGAGAASGTITMDPSLWNGSITVPNGGSSITAPYTYTTNNTGGAGQFLTTGSNGTSWNTGTTVHIDADGLTMKEGADIKIGGKSLTEAIEKIEERLGILNPNPALEERWDKLKDLRRQYIEMEKDILEKEKIMKILKG